MNVAAAVIESAQENLITEAVLLWLGRLQVHFLRFTKGMERMEKVRENSIFSCCTSPGWRVGKGVLLCCSVALSESFFLTRAESSLRKLRKKIYWLLMLQKKRKKKKELAIRNFWICMLLQIGIWLVTEQPNGLVCCFLFWLLSAPPSLIKLSIQKGW